MGSNSKKKHKKHKSKDRESKKLHHHKPSLMINNNAISSPLISVQQHQQSSTNNISSSSSSTATMSLNSTFDGYFDSANINDTYDGHHFNLNHTHSVQPNINDSNDNLINLNNDDINSNNDITNCRKLESSPVPHKPLRIVLKVHSSGGQCQSSELQLSPQQQPQQSLIGSNSPFNNQQQQQQQSLSPLATDSLINDSNLNLINQSNENQHVSMSKSMTLATPALTETPALNIKSTNLKKLKKSKKSKKSKHKKHSHHHHHHHNHHHHHHHNHHHHRKKHQHNSTTSTNINDNINLNELNDKITKTNNEIINHDSQEQMTTPLKSSASMITSTLQQQLSSFANIQENDSLISNQIDQYTGTTTFVPSIFEQKETIQSLEQPPQPFKLIANDNFQFLNSNNESKNIVMESDLIDNQIIESMDDEHEQLLNNDDNDHKKRNALRLKLSKSDKSSNLYKIPQINESMEANSLFSLSTAPTVTSNDATSIQLNANDVDEQQQQCENEIMTSKPLSSCSSFLSSVAINHHHSHSKSSPLTISNINKKDDTKTPLKQLLRFLLRQLQRKDQQKFFAQPVSDTIAPGYSAIITQPMDLSTIKTKIQTEYRTLGDFKEDVKLMCDNAMKYNRPDTIYYKAANKLWHYTKNKLFKQNSVLDYSKKYPKLTPLELSLMPSSQVMMSLNLQTKLAESNCNNSNTLNNQDQKFISLNSDHNQVQQFNIFQSQNSLSNNSNNVTKFKTNFFETLNKNNNNDDNSICNNHIKNEDNFKCSNNNWSRNQLANNFNETDKNDNTTNMTSTVISNNNNDFDNFDHTFSSSSLSAVAAAATSLNGRNNDDISDNYNDDMISNVNFNNKIGTIIDNNVYQQFSPSSSSYNTLNGNSALPTMVDSMATTSNQSTHNNIPLSNNNINNENTKNTNSINFYPKYFKAFANQTKKLRDPNEELFDGLTATELIESVKKAARDQHDNLRMKHCPAYLSYFEENSSNKNDGNFIIYSINDELQSHQYSWKTTNKSTTKSKYFNDEFRSMKFMKPVSLDNIYQPNENGRIDVSVLTTNTSIQSTLTTINASSLNLTHTTALNTNTNTSSSLTKTEESCSTNNNSTKETDDESPTKENDENNEKSNNDTEQTTNNGEDQNDECKEKTEELMNELQQCYGNDNFGLEYALSIAKFAKNSDYTFSLVTSLLSVLTDNKHRLYMNKFNRLMQEQFDNL